MTVEDAQPSRPREEPDAKPIRSRIRPIPLFVVAQIALATVLALTTGLLVMHLRERALVAAEKELDSISLVLADQAEQGFEAVELVQIALLERLQNAGMRTPDDFRRMMSGPSNYEDLRDRTSTLPQLDALTAIDTDGNLVNFSRYWPVPQVNVADRDYFQALAGDPGMTTFIGQLVPNRGTGTWTIYLARKATAPDGTFLGLILAAVQLNYFETLYQKVVAGQDMAISMFRNDGTLLARYPRGGGRIGQSITQGLVLMQPEAVSKGRLVVRKKSQVDGKARVIAAHAMVHFPMAVNVTDTEDSILVDWRQQATYLGSAAVIVELVMSAVGLLMLRQLHAQRMLADARAAHTEAEAARRETEAELALAHEREAADRTLHTQNLRFSAALGNMSQALCMFDADDCVIVANSRLAELFNAPSEDIAPGLTVSTALSRLTSNDRLPAVDAELLRASLTEFRTKRERVSAVMTLSNGRSLAVHYAPVEDDGWLVTLEDITERRQAEDRIAHMAHHDALTGLPNRVLFHSKLGEAVARGQRGEMSAVLFLDLDHFKSVNDTLGHPIGDALLREVTRRLRHQLRATDTVARLGGDEFAILQSNVQPGFNQQRATALAERLIETIGEPYELGGHRIIIGTSVGIAVIPDDGDDPDQLLKNADLALYRAKGEGRGRYCFFEPGMDARMQARRLLEVDLRNAMTHRQFEVFYQPLMNLKTRMVAGFEALLRWNHPDRGMVSPADFIPLVEEIGLIIPLSKWIMLQACTDASSWPGNQTVAVNLSAVQFSSRTLVADVAAVLQQTGLDPARLELEITETVMLEDTESVVEILHQLRDLGVSIAMDDFGTGYSSLSYLRRFPFDKVKIDRSFIEGLGQGGDCDAIVKAVTELCETLGMTTTAEGVETEEQLQQLYAGNCTHVQGYLFSRPRPAREVAEMCRMLIQEHPEPGGDPEADSCQLNGAAAVEMAASSSI